MQFTVSCHKVIQSDSVEWRKCKSDGVLTLLLLLLLLQMVMMMMVD